MPASRPRFTPSPGGGSPKRGVQSRPQNAGRGRSSPVDSSASAAAPGTSPESQQIGPDDFRFVQIVGRGSYGVVWEAVKIDTRETYAIKVLEKVTRLTCVCMMCPRVKWLAPRILTAGVVCSKQVAPPLQSPSCLASSPRFLRSSRRTRSLRTARRSLHLSTPIFYPHVHTHAQDDILRRGNIDQVLEEKRILQTVTHPFIVSLHFAFQVRRESDRERDRERERRGERG